MVFFRNCLIILSLLAVTPAFADPGEPIAVRRWPAGAISIETMWDLNLVIDTTGKASAEIKATADQVVALGDEVQHVLYRLPNAEEVKWEPLAKQRKESANEVIVKSLQTEGSDSAWGIQVMVDGISVLCFDINALPNNSEKTLTSVSSQDVIVVTASSHENVYLPNVQAFLKSKSPQIVILNPTSDSKANMDAFAAAVAEKGQAIVRTHNTVAVSGTADQPAEFKLYSLAEKPQAMPEKLAELFERMEKSCAASQQVFMKLSVDQMNWKPSNGTHTPRWNTEHMMGRQLLFFSQIYRAVNPVIPALNLNPKQMPDDYKYAHSDWSGAEEARQMQRVSKFTRRFAYLIHDLNVDKRAPGSRWPSLKALLLQMERHYSEHTANTVKKFKLSDWPNK